MSLKKSLSIAKQYIFEFENLTRYSTYIQIPSNRVKRDGYKKESYEGGKEKAYDRY